MSDQLTQMTRTLARAGFRLTAARRAILRALVDGGGHVTADTLAGQLRRAEAGVGRMTVYRTLELLCDLGLIRPVYLGTGAAHYVLLDEGGHHHLICNRCGHIIEFSDCVGDEVGRTLSRRFDFEIQSHLLEFHGLCSQCRNPEPA